MEPSFRYRFRIGSTLKVVALGKPEPLACYPKLLGTTVSGTKLRTVALPDPPNGYISARDIRTACAQRIAAGWLSE